MGMIDAGTKTLYEGDSAALAARNPTSGMTPSTRCAAVSAIRRPPQDGHMPRDLQKKARTRSSLQVWQKIRRKPRASTPQSRKDRNSFLKSSSPSDCSRDGRSQFDSVVTEKPNADGDRAGIDVRNVDFCLARNQQQD